MKRRYNSTGATFEESRRVRLKQNGPSTLGKNDSMSPYFSCTNSLVMYLCENEPQVTTFFLSNVVLLSVECTTGNASCSASKLMFQEDIEAASSASMGFHPVNSSKSYKRSFNLESSIPTKAMSPVPASRSRRPNNRQTARSSNGLPQLNNPAPTGQVPDAGRIQAKRQVGRPRRERR